MTWKSLKEGYTGPYFHGIEHLTIDHEGVICWKGVHVEHYDIPWAYSDEGRAEATALARRCRILEARGKVVNTVTAVWAWW